MTKVTDKKLSRERMLKVRADVKAYISGSKTGLDHLGQYPKNMGDAKRTIIALQDMLEDESVRHEKASNHILSLLKQIENMDKLSTFIVNNLVEHSSNQDIKIASMIKDRNRIHKNITRDADEIKRLNAGWYNSNEEILDLQEKLEASMHTLKTALTS